MLPEIFIESPPFASHCRRTRLTADVLTPHLRALDEHDAAAPPLLVPPLAAPAAVPAPVERLERAPRQRALGQQRRRRRVRRVPLEARRQRVRARLRRKVAAGLALRGRRFARGPPVFRRGVVVLGRRRRALLGRR